MQHEENDTTAEAEAIVEADQITQALKIFRDSERQAKAVGMLLDDPRSDAGVFAFETIMADAAQRMAIALKASVSTGPGQEK